MPFTLTTHPFDLSTPGLLNPAIFGPLFQTIAGGQYVEAAVIIDVPADEPSYIELVLSTDGSADVSTLLRRQLAILSSDQVAALQEASARDSGGGFYPNAFIGLALTNSSCGLYAGVFPEMTDPTGFAGQLVIKTYS